MQNSVSTMSDAADLQDGTNKLLKCDHCNYIAFHKEHLNNHLTSLHPNKAGLVKQEPFNDHSGARASEDEDGNSDSNSDMDMQEAEVKEDEEVQLVKEADKAISAKRLYCCHVCEYLTFEQNHLLNHFESFHGLNTPSESIIMLKEFVQVCKYSNSAFKTATGDVQKPWNGRDCEEDLGSIYGETFEVDMDPKAVGKFDQEDDDFFVRAPKRSKEDSSSCLKAKSKPNTPILPDIKTQLKVEPDLDGKYHCPECNFSGDTENNVRKHYGRMHIQKTSVYQCPACDFETHKRQSFNLHIKSVHQKIKDVKCDYCDYASSFTNNVKRHIQRAHLNKKEEKEPPKRVIKTEITDFEKKRSQWEETGEVPEDYGGESLILDSATNTFRCEYCGYATEHKRYMKDHIRKVHFNSNLYPCKFCDFTTPFLKTFKQHMVNTHPDEYNHIQCNMCDYRTSKQIRLDYHMKKVHYKARDFHCEYCSFTASDKIKLENHYNANHSEVIAFLPVQTIIVYTSEKGRELYKCNKCDYNCTMHHVMRTHKNTVHNESNEFAKCALCEFAPLGELEMADHLEKHHAEKMELWLHKFDFNVPDEENKLDFNTNNPFHYRYNGIPVKRVFRCDSCDYSNAERHIIVKHRRLIHENIKEFMCDYCSYSTNKTFHLNRHIKSKHLGTKEFMCEHCEYSTALKWNLSNHMKKHEKTRESKKKKRLVPYQLSVVDGSYECTKCPLTFPTEKNVRDHYKQAHMTHNNPQQPPPIPVPSAEVRSDVMSPNSENSNLTQTPSHSHHNQPQPPHSVATAAPGIPVNPGFNYSVFQHAAGLPLHMQYFNQMNQM